METFDMLLETPAPYTHLDDVDLLQQLVTTAHIARLLLVLTTTDLEWRADILLTAYDNAEGNSTLAVCSFVCA